MSRQPNPNYPDNISWKG